MIDEVLDLVAQRAELGLPLEGADDYLAAEIVYAVTHEGARHLDDVLTRRTRVSIETFDRGVAAAPGIARLMGADCVLLIAAALSDADLRRFHDLAGEVGLDALVEVHDEPELERAMATGATLVGVNQRSS